MPNGETEIPQFRYRFTVLTFELIILLFVNRSLREADIELYKFSTIAIAPWFFVLNHRNYSRLLPMHIRHMEMLEIEFLSVAIEFQRLRETLLSRRHTVISLQFP